MGDVERIMERVRRLLAIANDPAASDNEQHIALEQAQRLMNKHAIEEWQLEEDHDDVEIIERRIRLETNPCNRYMAQLANIVAHGNRCRAAYECRRAGNGRDVVSTVWIYGARVDVDKTESIWTAMETRSTNGSKNTSPSATDGRNSPSPRDPASPPTGTDDRTGHARPSDSRRPARSPIGLWKSRKTPAKYHTCVIYLGYRQGIGQPASPQ